MTDGLVPPAAFSAIFSPAQAGRPTAPAAIVQTFRKFLRETPFASSRARRLSPELELSISATSVGRHISCPRIQKATDRPRVSMIAVNVREQTHEVGKNTVKTGT